MKYIPVMIVLALVGGIIATPTMLKNINQYLDNQTLIGETTKTTTLNNAKNAENAKNHNNYY